MGMPWSNADGCLKALSLELFTDPLDLLAPRRFHYQLDLGLSDRHQAEAAHVLDLKDVDPVPSQDLRQAR